MKIIKIKKIINKLKVINSKICLHSDAYFFHDNAPQYCPGCNKYIDGGNVI